MENEIKLVGHITDTPQCTLTKNGQIICRFQIATQDPFMSRDERRGVLYHTVVVFGVRAPQIPERYEAGDLVRVKGKSVPRRYQSANGKHNYSHSVYLTTMRKLSARERQKALSENKLTSQKNF